MLVACVYVRMYLLWHVCVEQIVYHAYCTHVHTQYAIGARAVLWLDLGCDGDDDM
jgi:hypothetical protein